MKEPSPSRRPATQARSVGFIPTIVHDLGPYASDEATGLSRQRGGFDSRRPRKFWPRKSTGVDAALSMQVEMGSIPIRGA